VPLHLVASDIRRAGRAVHGAPQYVLGPICTDVAAGHDHVAGAIGAAVAASEGADFLCAVTPGEHLRLPTLEDIHAGIMAFRVAAHVGDVARERPGARERDRVMSEARHELCWAKQAEHALDHQAVLAEIARQELVDGESCGMCGEVCALKQLRR
jgi:phosphomethylpyrimidine synthase